MLPIPTSYVAREAFVGIYPRGTTTRVHRKTYAQWFIEAFFIVDRNGEILCLQHEGFGRVVEYYTAVKRKELFTHASPAWVGRALC